MPAQVTNYQCPACTGPLQFDGSTGKLECEYCRSSFPIQEIEALYAEKEARAAEAMTAAEEKRKQDPSGTADEWDMSGMIEDWGTDADGMRMYQCPSCSAELICEETTAATSCPYCGNTTVVPGQFTGMLKPHYVLPFRLKKEDAIQALKKHYEGKYLLPKEFKDSSHLEEIKGVYVPFWLFDGEAEGAMAFEGTKSRTYTSGEYEVTETRHFEVYRKGSAAFERIPVDGSRKMPDDYMDSIEPFDYSALTDFSTAYLPGFLADKYDMTAEECSARADSRAEASLIHSLRNTVKGYDLVTEKSRTISLSRGEVKYALLPVWLLTTRWRGENYLFAMNGQTGKFVGNLPVDKGKRWRIFAAVYGIAALVTGLLVLFPGGLSDLLRM